MARPATNRLPLPAGVRLAPHRRMLSLGPAARMIGLDPATALVVEDLTPALACLVDALAEPADPWSLIAGAGAEAAPAASLLRRLLEVGAVVDAAAARHSAARRAVAVVHVHGDGPLAAGLAATLARAGIGAVHAAHPAAVQAVRRATPAARTGPPPQRSRPDLAVLADALVPDEDLVERLVADRTAHLAVRLRDGAGAVGPLVLPGRSPCLRCLDLHRVAREPAWPQVAAQLAGQAGSADAECVAATVGLGTAQALAALDTGATPPPALGATLTCDPAAGTIVRQPWAAHPECPCASRTTTRVTCGSAQRRGTMER